MVVWVVVEHNWMQILLALVVTILYGCGMDQSEQRGQSNTRLDHHKLTIHRAGKVLDRELLSKTARRLFDLCPKPVILTNLAPR